MRRRLLNFAAIVSVLFLVATAALWVRSYFHADAFLQERTWNYPETEKYNAQLENGVMLAPSVTVYTITIYSDRGTIGVHHQGSFEFDGDGPPDSILWEQDPPYETKFIQSLISAAPASRFGVWTNITLNWNDFKRRWEGDTLSVSVDHWLLAALFGVLPVLNVAVHIRRRQRITAGVCLSCGYDLRATPDRCPECGSKVTT